MIKTLADANRSERVRFRIPRSVQESIPVSEIYGDGIWHVRRRHSKCWRLSDINYVSASDEERKGILGRYSRIMASLPTGANVKITIVNHGLNTREFQRTMLMPMRENAQDIYREEMNSIISSKAAESQNLVQEKFITISVPEQKIADSRLFFSQMSDELSRSFSLLKTNVSPLNNHDRLRIFHNFFRPGEEDLFNYDVTCNARNGMDFKDIICPDSLVFKGHHFRMGDKFGRVLFIREYGAFAGDKILSDLSVFAKKLMLSIDLIAIPTNEALKEVNQRILGTEANISRWQQKQNSHHNYTSEPPHDLMQARATGMEYMEELSGNDQKMIMVLVTLVHIADSLEQLNADTKSIQALTQGSAYTFSVLGEQQEDGLNTALPYGLRPIRTTRTMTSQSVTALMPFRTRDIQEQGGVYYGINSISKNLLVCDRKQLVSPHAFYLGVSGSGKSMGMKQTVAHVALNTDDDIIVVDAEREYGKLIQAMGGEVIEISHLSGHHINPLDVSPDYRDNEVIAAKTEIITSILEQHMAYGGLTATQKSIIDRCTKNILRPYLRSKGKRSAPTLMDWRKEVMKQTDPEARELALAAELITEGSLNIFAHASNVNMDNRIICLDLYEMGEQLRPTALVVVLEAINNRVISNRAKGKYTWVFLDEVYLYFKFHYSAEVLYRAWKRFRKYGGILTAATQNVQECLESETAKLMFANSEFLLLFNQAASDRQALAALLHISDTEMDYVTDVEPGHGLLRMSGSVVPFTNTIPQDTELYRLMSTSPGES